MTDFITDPTTGIQVAEPADFDGRSVATFTIPEDATHISRAGVIMYFKLEEDNRMMFWSMCDYWKPSMMNANDIIRADPLIALRPMTQDDRIFLNTYRQGMLNEETR